MKKTAPSVPLLIAGVALASLAGGTLLSSGAGCSNRAPATESRSSLTPPAESGTLPEPAPQPTPVAAGDTDTFVKPHSVVIYRVVTNDNGSHLQSATVRLPAAASSELPADALNAMSRFGKDSPLPNGAQAQTVVIDGSTATVDYNAAFQKNFTGGDENEALALNAITATLGQFAGVKQVQITVAGKKIDSLGGTQSLSTPLPVPQTVDGLRQTAQGDSGKSANP